MTKFTISFSPRRRDDRLEVSVSGDVLTVGGDARAMLDNRAVVAELAALRKEVAAMKEEQRQIGMGRWF